MHRFSHPLCWINMETAVQLLSVPGDGAMKRKANDSGEQRGWAVEMGETSAAKHHTRAWESWIDIIRTWTLLTHTKNESRIVWWFCSALHSFSSLFPSWCYRRWLASLLEGEKTTFNAKICWFSSVKHLLYAICLVPWCIHQILIADCGYFCCCFFLLPPSCCPWLLLFFLFPSHCFPLFPFFLVVCHASPDSSKNHPFVLLSLSLYRIRNTKYEFSPANHHVHTLSHFQMYIILIEWLAIWLWKYVFPLCHIWDNVGKVWNIPTQGI